MALKALDLLLNEESKRTASALEAAYGESIKAIATAEGNTLKAHVVTAGKDADLWNGSYMPLIRKACEDEALTMTAWNSLLTVHLFQVTEKRLAKTGSKLPSTFGIYHGLARDFPAMYRSEMLVDYQIAQAAKKAALIASGELEKASAIKDADEIDLESVTKEDLQRIIRNAVAMTRDKGEVELGEAVKDAGKALRNFVKESGSNKATLKQVKAIVAGLEKATKEATARKGKTEQDETPAEPVAAPLTEAATQQAEPVAQAA